MRTIIYALLDPREPDLPRYVGKTTDPADRLKRHRKAPRKARDAKTYRGKWIAKIQSEGVEPVMLVLVRVPFKHEDAAEREMIRRFRRNGAPLTNGTDGGEGGRLTPELQAQATAKLRAKYESGELQPPRMTPEQRATANLKIAASKRGDNNPMKRPEVIAKNKATNRARNEVLGRKPKVWKTKRGTPEWREMVKERNRVTNQKRRKDK